MKKHKEVERSKTKPKKVSRKGSRKLLSLFRVFRYGLENFFRNSWLSVAATAVMVITLLIIFSAFLIQLISTDTVEQLRNKVDMSIYLQPKTVDGDVNLIIEELKKLPSVISVKYVSSEDARKQIANDNAGNPDVLEAIKEATNKTPSTIRVVVKDINDTSELEKFVSDNETVKKNISADYKPSFAGDRRQSIQSIGKAVSFAQKSVIAAGILFVVISSLIIFNTIQMAIFNRKEEIQMMKLIGADKSFIRGPFLVESVICGILAAVFASGFGILMIHQSRSVIEKYFYVNSAIELVTDYAIVVTLTMMLIGSIIGVVSSLFATRKYLKI